MRRTPVRTSKVAARLAVALLWVGLGLPTAPGAPSSEETNHIVLKSGAVLRGRIVDEVKTEAGKMWKIETDFGVIHVPRRAVKKKVQNEAIEDDGTFAIREIRVVRIKGDVRRSCSATFSECNRMTSRTRSFFDSPRSSSLPTHHGIGRQPAQN